MITKTFKGNMCTEYNCCDNEMIAGLDEFRVDYYHSVADLR